jgi:hypothetical protein
MPLGLAMIFGLITLVAYQEHRPCWFVLGAALLTIGVFKSWWRRGHHFF